MKSSRLFIKFDVNGKNNSYLAAKIKENTSGTT